MSRCICWTLLAGVCMTLAACSKSEPLGGVTPVADQAAADAPAPSLEQAQAKIAAVQAEKTRQAEEQAAKEAEEIAAREAAAAPGPRPSVLLNVMAQPLQALMQNSVQSLMSGGGPLQDMLPSRNANKQEEKPAQQAQPAQDAQPAQEPPAEEAKPAEADKPAE